MYEEAKGFYIKQLNVYVNSIEGSKIHYYGNFLLWPGLW